MVAGGFFALFGAALFESNLGRRGPLRQESHGGAWCPKQQITTEPREWLEIDLHTVHMITATGTQGRFGNGQGVEYSEAYMLEYWRPKLGKWVRYRDVRGEEVSNRRCLKGVAIIDQACESWEMVDCVFHLGERLSSAASARSIEKGGENLSRYKLSRVVGSRESCGSRQADRSDARVELTLSRVESSRVEFAAGRSSSDRK
ncbi:hypothetical protein K0M31_017986 [Melipona bicolor]|uniref:F5/8 type C domain-containing protein n=1 Tax=Melipona bicolor TaxID=60889 RepID=A0AA40FDC5_9HYME|nr:hypothetical protein K0M31_017986 [Melipona bicolor]